MGRSAVILPTFQPFYTCFIRGLWKSSVIYHCGHRTCESCYYQVDTRGRCARLFLPVLHMAMPGCIEDKPRACVGLGTHTLPRHH